MISIRLPIFSFGFTCFLASAFVFGFLLSLANVTFFDMLWWRVRRRIRLMLGWGFSLLRQERGGGRLPGMVYGIVEIDLGSGLWDCFDHY